MKRLKHSRHYSIFLMSILFILVITVYVAFAVLSPAVTATEQVGAIDNKYKFALDLGDAEGDFATGFIEGAQLAAAEYDIVLEIAGYNSSHRVGGEEFIEMTYMSRADALITVGVKTASDSNLAATYDDKHKKMLFTYYEPAANEKLMYVGPDNFVLGVDIATEILQTGSGDISVIILASEKDHAMLMAQGINSVARANSRLKVLDTVKIGDSQLSAMDASVNGILEHGDVDYFICANEHISLGAARGIIDINRVGMSRVTGVGISESLERYMDRDIVDFTIDIDAKTMGYEVVRNCFEAEEDAVFRWYTNSTVINP